MGMEKHLNAWLKNVTDAVTDQECEVFCKVFAFGKTQSHVEFSNVEFVDSASPCSKLYTANTSHARTIIQTLKMFDNVICFEMPKRPCNIVESVWAKYISSKYESGGGVVVAGAAHILALRMHLTIPNASYFTIYWDSAARQHLIRQFRHSVQFPLLTLW